MPEEDSNVQRLATLRPRLHHRPHVSIVFDPGDTRPRRGRPLALQVSDNGRYFLQNGKPFFWLGDAAWSIFVLYTKEEADTYLEHRTRQGFNVIQVMIPFNGGPRLETQASNRDGELPWHESNPAKLNEAYFKNVDYVIDLARRKGLVMYVLALGGSSGSFVDKEKVFTKENVRTYGR